MRLNNPVPSRFCHRPLHAAAQLVRVPTGTKTMSARVVDLGTDGIGHIVRPLLLSQALTFSLELILPL
jgi:hypothetical protein